MAMGLPIVASDVVPEYEMPSSYGMRVPVENSDALADALCRMADTYGQYDATAIRNHAISIASKQSVIGQLIDLYTRICNN
jgi:glycosyltransferase involved in cell wall biosynthesis